MSGNNHRLGSKFQRGLSGNGGIKKKINPYAPVPDIAKALMDKYGSLAVTETRGEFAHI